MIDVRFEPVSTWPRTRTAAHNRVKGVFSMTYIKVLNSLEKETGFLKAKDVVIEAGFSRDDIRNDGWPRSGARVPVDPGVILSFASKHGPLRMPCDHFKDWQSNLRAIALHLEHLRLASIYGVGEYGEQYKGWLRLEAGAPIAMEAGMTVEAARAFIADLAGVSADRVCGPVYGFHYKQAALKLHPDRGGDPALWDRLQRAKAVLDAHHGVAKNAGGAQ